MLKSQQKGHLRKTGTNSDRYESFAAVYVKLGRNDIFYQINISLSQQHTGLKYLDPV